MRREYWPEIVYVDEEAADDVITKRVLSRLPDAQVLRVSEKGDPLSAAGNSFEENELTTRFSQGKRQLLLTRYHGSWLKSCPGTSDHVCCNLWIVNPGEGCPLDCTYCYLQSYLRRNPTLKIYTNTDQMIETLREKAAASPGRLFRVGTGEVIDSLVWDELTDLSFDLVPFVGRTPNLTLELKSKTALVENLLQLKNEHNEKTVVSWSVNAREVSEKDEAFTASLDERIEAACKVMDAGYRVGFHFDPMIHFEGWQEGYRDIIQTIFKQVDVSRIAWVSLSTLRYKPEMQRVMIERFPESKIPFGEQFLAKDGKLRYIQPIRFQMLNYAWKELKSFSEQLPVYMCMESSSAWHEVAGGPPVAGSELVEIFSRRGKLPVLPAESLTV